MAIRKTKLRHNKCKGNRKTRRHNHYRKGGSGEKTSDSMEKVRCCMCGKIVNKNDALIPRECLVKHGKNKAHRICKECWWDLKKGFAREDAPHGCPGCIKGLPLTKCKKEEPVLVDLTED